MPFCNNCGSQLPEGANVCPQCGTPTAQGSYAPPLHRTSFSLKKTIASIAKIFPYIMFGFAAVAVLYGFINGIVAGSRSSFGMFIAIFFEELFNAAVYVFLGIASGYISKKLEE